MEAFRNYGFDSAFNLGVEMRQPSRTTDDDVRGGASAFSAFAAFVEPGAERRPTARERTFGAASQQTQEA